MFRRQILSTTLTTTSSLGLVATIKTSRAFRTRKAFDGPAYLAGDDFISPHHGVEHQVADEASTFRLSRASHLSDSLSGGGNSVLAETATGLAKDGVGQMTSEDVLMRIETAIKWFNPTAYAWLLLPSIDLIDCLVISEVVPRDQPHLHLSRWFSAPEDIVHYPDTLKDTLGLERYKAVEPAILNIFNDYQQISPLLRVLSRYPELPRDIWTSLARWMAAMSSNTDMKDVILGLTLAISNGLGPQTLGLPDLQQQRGTIVGHILMGAGAEYGAVSLAQLGVDLLLINGSQCSFQDQKTLTASFSRTSSRMMDWSVRSSGELVRCLPRWFSHHIAGNKDAKLVQLLTKQQAMTDASNEREGGEEEGKSSKETAKSSINLDDEDDLEKFGDDMEAVEITNSSDMYTSEEAAAQSEKLAMALEEQEEREHEEQEMQMKAAREKARKQRREAEGDVDEDDDDDDVNADSTSLRTKDGQLLSYGGKGRPPGSKTRTSDSISFDDINEEEDDDLLNDDRSTRMMTGRKATPPTPTISSTSSSDSSSSQNDEMKLTLEDHANEREALQHGEDEDDEPAASALLGSAPTSNYFSTKKSSKEYYDSLHKNLLKQAVERKKLVTKVQESHSKKRNEKMVPKSNRATSRLGGQLKKASK